MALNQKRKLGIYLDRQPLDSPSAFAAASSSSNCFPGSRAILNFGGVNGQGISHSFDLEETSYDCFDEYCLTQPEKKRRLSIDQVEFLEKCFVADNRLEPERKIKLAKELNLKPRQVAIWFQNRRARWRNKQLETDYEALHASFVSLKNDYDKLVEENEKLKSEVLLSKPAIDEVVEKPSSGLFLSSAHDEAMTAIVYCQDEDFKELAMDGIHLFRMETGESSLRILDQSDASLNEEDELLETLDNSSKTEDSFFDDGLQVEDNFWSY